MKRIFIFQDAKSQKFWSIDVEGTSFIVEYGRLGTSGQTSSKSFDSEDKCQKEAEKLIAEKTKKGYTESTEDTVKSTKAEAKKYFINYDSGSDVEDLANKILKDPKRADLKHIVVGSWGDGGEGEDCQAIVDMFVENADKFSHLESLFIGDMDSEECEVSWIAQANYSKIFKALPSLKSFTIKGSQGLELGKVQHPVLQSLEIICGGLGDDVIKEIAGAELPNLETLKLWLGVEDYGFDSDVETIASLASKKTFPKLKYLGLMNSEMVDDFVLPVISSDIMPQLEVLDFSMGTLTDKGAQIILDNADKLKHLKMLDLHWHFLSEDMMAKLKKLPCKVDVSDAQGDDDDYQYPMLTE